MTALLPIHRAFGLAAALVPLAIVAGRAARADAIPPAPDCPCGQSYVASHGPPSCVPEAPTNCPAGWQGVVGGNCVLFLCNQPADCPDGFECKPESVCFLRQELWYHRYPRGSLQKLEHPEIEWHAARVCAASTTCLPPNECRPAKLCLPRGVDHATPELPVDWKAATGGYLCNPRVKVTALVGGALIVLTALVAFRRWRRSCRGTSISA
jgi:hypothetical protein